MEYVDCQGCARHHCFIRLISPLAAILLQSSTGEGSLRFHCLSCPSPPTFRKWEVEIDMRRRLLLRNLERDKEALKEGMEAAAKHETSFENRCHRRLRRRRRREPEIEISASTQS